MYNVIGFTYSYFFNEDFFLFSIGSYDGKIFSPAVRTETLFALAIFQLFIHWGAILFLTINKGSKIDINLSSDQDSFRKLSRRIGLFIFFLFLVPAYFFYFEVAKEAFLMGGYGNYAFNETMGTTNQNIFIRMSDDFFMFGFLLFLASVPDKKAVVLPIILYLLPFLAMSIFTGSRVHVITQSLMVVSYFATINAISSKKLIIYMSLLLLLATFIGIYRYSTDYDLNYVASSVEESDSNPFKDFAIGQGASAQTIALTIQLHKDNNLDHSLKFLTYPLFSQNGFVPDRVPNDYYNLSDRLSYYYTGNFSNGGGVGSSIVAECYAIGGMLGVVFFSAFFGFIILFLISKISNPLSFLLFLMLLPGIYYTSRSYYLTSLLTAKFQVLLLLILVFGVKFFRTKPNL